MGEDNLNFRDGFAALSVSASARSGDEMRFRRTVHQSVPVCPAHTAADIGRRARIYARASSRVIRATHQYQDGPSL